MKCRRRQVLALLAFGIFVAIGMGWCPENARAATVTQSLFSWVPVSGTNGPNGYGSFTLSGVSTVPAPYQVTRGDVTDATSGRLWSATALTLQSKVEWSYQRYGGVGPGVAEGDLATWGVYSTAYPLQSGYLTTVDLPPNPGEVDGYNDLVPYEWPATGNGNAPGPLSGTATMSLTNGIPWQLNGTGTHYTLPESGLNHRLFVSGDTGWINGVTAMKTALLTGPLSTGAMDWGDIAGPNWNPDTSPNLYIAGGDRSWTVITGWHNLPTTDPNYAKYGGGYFTTTNGLNLPYFNFANKPLRSGDGVSTGPAAFNGALNFQTYTGPANGTWDNNQTANWQANTSVGLQYFGNTGTTQYNTWFNGETAAAFGAGSTTTINIANSGITNVVSTYGITTGTSSNYTFAGGPLVITGNFANNILDPVTGTTTITQNLYNGGVNVAGGTNSNGGTGTVAFTNAYVTVGASSTWTVPANSSLSVGSSTPVNLNVNTLTLAGNGTTTINGKILDINDQSNQTVNPVYGLMPGTTGSLVVGGGTVTPGSPLVILNGTNTYSGSTTVNSGTLTLNSAHPIENSTLIWNGGALNLTPAVSTLTLAGLGGSATGTLSPSTALNITGGTVSGLPISNTANNPFAGQLSGGFALNVSQGALGLSGNSSGVYTGAIGITNGGSISISNGGALGTGNTVTVGNSGTVQFAAPMTFSHNVSIASGGTATFDTLSGNNAVFDTTKSISGAGSLAVTSSNGNGTLTLSGVTNTYAGATYLNGGTVVASSLSNFGSGTVLNLNGATLQWAGSFDPTANGHTLSFGSGTTSTLKFYNNSQTFAGTLSGAGAFTFNSGGSLTLNAASPQFTGGISMPSGGGTLTLGNSNALQNASLAITNGSPGVDNVQFTGTDYLGGLSASVNGPLGSGTLTIPSTEALLSVASGNIQYKLTGGASSGIFQKSGTGTLSLAPSTASGSNTYAFGTTTVSGGALQFVDGKGVPTTTNINLAGGSWMSSGAATISRTLGTTSGTIQLKTGTDGFIASGGAVTVNLNGNGGSLSWGSAPFAPSALLLDTDGGTTSSMTFANSLYFNPGSISGAAGTITVPNYAATLSGSLSGSSKTSLTKTGGGTLFLSNTANATGFTGTVSVKGGILAPNSASCLPNGNLSLGGGLLELVNGFNLTRNLGTGTGTVQLPTGDSGFIAQNGSVTVNLGASNSVTWGSSNPQFNPTTLELQNVSSTTSAGAMTFSVGTLSLSSSSTINVPIDTSLTGLTVNGNPIGGFVAPSTSTLSAQLTGSGALVKTGGGTLVLNDTASASNYTGGDAFNGGMVQTTTNTSLGNGGAWSFNGGEVLFGTGTTGTYSPSSVTINSASGSLTGGGTLSTASGVNASINALITTNGTGSLLTVTGAGAVSLTAAGTSTLNAGLNVAGGTLSLGNDTSPGGSLNLVGTATAAINNGGTLMFDDNAGTTARLNSTAVVTVNSGGLLLKGPSAGGNDTQSVYNLNLLGPTTIGLVPSSSGTATLSIGNDLSMANDPTIPQPGRALGSTVLFTGTNLGGTVSGASASRVIDTSSTGITLSQAFVHDSPTTGIIPYAIGGTSSGMGLVTYDNRTANGSVVGVRPLNTNEYAYQNFGGDNNVMGTASTTIGSGGTTTIHSLTMTGNVTDTVNGVLNLDSGAIVSGTNTGGAGNTITGGTIICGTNSATLAPSWSNGSTTTTETFIHTLSDLTLGSTIKAFNYNGGIHATIVKDGPGNLTLMSGQSVDSLYLNAGKLTLGINALFASPGGLTINGGTLTNGTSGNVNVGGSILAGYGPNTILPGNGSAAGTLALGYNWLQLNSNSTLLFNNYGSANDEILQTGLLSFAGNGQAKIDINTGDHWTGNTNYTLINNIDSNNAINLSQLSLVPYGGGSLPSGTYLEYVEDDIIVGTTTTRAWDLDVHIGSAGLSPMFQGVPEPATLALLAAGAIGLLLYAWRKRR